MNKKNDLDNTTRHYAILQLLPGFYVFVCYKLQADPIQIVVTSDDSSKVHKYVTW